MAKDLREGIYEAVYKWSSLEKLPPGETKEKQIKKAKDLSNAIGDSIKDYLLENTWTITDMKANIQVDHIKTSDSIPTDVEPQTLAGPYAPILSAIKKLGFDLFSPVRAQIEKVSASGANTHGLKLHKYNKYGQGGRLDAKGKALIGPSDNTVYDIGSQINTEWNNKSTVQLDKSKLKLDKKVK